MGKKLGIIILLAILTIMILASGCIQQDQKKSNTSSSSQNEVQKVSNKAASIDIIATQNGPVIAHKGQNVIINYTVSNNGTQSVYNVKVHDQNFDKTLGTIKPGEDKKFQHPMYIPTDEQVKADFGPDATVSNPFFVGGFIVSFQDANGSKHSLTANSIDIKLV